MTAPSKLLYPKIPVGYAKWPSMYNDCPSCDGMKFKRSALCMNCKIGGRPPIDQPSDPHYRLIPLTRGQVAIVDAADYEYLMQWKWFALYVPEYSRYYAYRKQKIDGKEFHIAMHDAIMGVNLSLGLRVDHIKSKETLNNRRSNLRIVTFSQNAVNRSMMSNNTTGCTGVYCCGYYAYINVDGKRISLGHFKEFESAKKARLEAEIKYHGEYSPRHKK